MFYGATMSILAPNFGANSLRELEETAYWLELLADAKIVPPEKLLAVRNESDQLVAIFVTILKRSKETS